MALDYPYQMLCMSRAILLDIWKSLMMGSTSQGEVLDGQRVCD